MDSDEKDNDALFESENEDENEDDIVRCKDEDGDCGGEEEQNPPAEIKVEKTTEAELGQGDNRELDYMEGDGEFVEGGDATPALVSVVKEEVESGKEEEERGETDSVDCRVEDILDEDHAEFIQSLKVWGNADQIERELVKMPLHEDAVDEVKCARDDRVITLHPFGLEDFSNPKFLAALREKGCEEVRHQFIRPEGSRDDWVGFVLLNFGSASSALRAAEELKDFRDGVEVKVQIQGSQSSRFNIRRWKAAVKGKHRWSDGLLLVKNIGESTSESKLSALFPGASILMHRESSPTDVALKGTRFAFVVCGAKEEADIMLDKYKGKKITLDGRRLVVMRYYNPEKMTLPEGMLRLGERRLVMHNIDELNEMIGSANRDTTPLQNKVTALQDLIDKDDHVRQEIGLPNPSFDRLSKMNSLRSFSEREKTTILQRLLNPSQPPPTPAAPPTPSKPEAPKAENGGQSSAAKAGQNRKRKNRGKQSSKETAAVVLPLNLNTPPPILPLIRPAFIPRLQVPQLASPPGNQPLRMPFPPMLRGAAQTALMRTPLPPRLQPPSLGNWMQPPPVSVPPPAIGPLGSRPPPRIPSLVPPVPAPTVPPPRLLNPAPGRPSPVPPPAPFASRPQRGLSSGGLPQWRVPPPSGMPPRPPGLLPRPSGMPPQSLLGMPGDVREPPLKLARFDRPPPRSLLGSMPAPKFRPRMQQRRF